MTKEEEKINKILDKHEMLRFYVKNVATSVDHCSNDTPSEMRLAKGHLDFIHYSQKMLDTSDYTTINNLLSDIGMAFKKCKCE